MAERKANSDWRHKQANGSSKRYSRARVLEGFGVNEVPFKEIPPVSIFSLECLRPLGGVSPGFECCSSRSYLGGKEKMPEWYLDDKDEEISEGLREVEEKFSQIDVLYEEKIKTFAEEDEKIPEWEDQNLSSEEAENEVIIYPAGLIKKYAEEGNPFAAIILSHSTETEESLVTNPNSIPFEKVWYYKDPQNNTQGPFSTIEMFNWSAAGYFTSNLQIAHSTPCHFFALQMYVLQEKYKLLSNYIDNN